MKSYPYWLPLSLYLVWDEAIATIKKHNSIDIDLQMPHPEYHKSRGVIIGICCTLGQDAELFLN
jgi:hypothetical protein